MSFIKYIFWNYKSLLFLWVWLEKVWWNENPINTIENISDEITELQDQIERLDAGIKIEWNIVNYFKNPEELQKDPEARYTFLFLKRAKNKLFKLQQEKAFLLESNKTLPQWGFTKIKKKLQGRLEESLKEKTRDQLTAEDIHRLKEKGHDLANIFLKNVFGLNNYAQKNTIKKWEILVVDFWINPEAKKYIWAADLLPEKVKKVKITDTSWNVREWQYRNNPRPWFYDEIWYLKIYDGYTIEILKTWELDKKEKKDYNNAHFKRFKKFREEGLRWEIYSDTSRKKVTFESEWDLRIFKESVWWRFEDNFTQDWLELTVKDEKSIEEKWRELFVETNYVKHKESAKEYIWKRWSHKPFLQILNQYAKQYRVPVEIVIHLIYKENHWWDPTIYTWNSKTETGVWSAFWLGQFTKDTWKAAKERILKNSWINIWEHGDKNPIAQIHAVTELLQYNRRKKNCTWQEAVAYHNTGLEILAVSRKKILRFARINGVISNLIPWVVVRDRKIIEWEELITPKKYFTAAVAYYNDMSYQDALSYRGS